MSDGDRESSGDEHSAHGVPAIPQEGPPQMPMPEAYWDSVVRNLASSMAQHFQLSGSQTFHPRERSRPSRRFTLLSEFQRFDPPRYCGDEGPEAAEMWIRDLDKMFGAVRCWDSEMVLLAEYNLRGEADFWWHATRSALGNSSEVTWEDFKRIFMDNYFPFTVREAKALEFEQLIQGRMTVLQYARKFAELSKYASYLVQDPIERAKRFQRGLNPEIRMHLMPLKLTDYDEMLERAQMIERMLEEMRGHRPVHVISSSSSSGKRPFQGRQADQGPSKRISTSGSSSKGSSSDHSE